MWNNFVSFDLAKKLRDKEFKEECFAHYDDLGNLLLDKDYWKLDSHILAPTISQVIDWLREEMRIYIIIEPYPSHSTPEKIVWEWHYKWKSNGQDMITESPDENTYIKYDEAAWACFNYIFNNLI